MKIKNEASGCPCLSKEKEECLDINCPIKQKYILDNKNKYDIDLEPNKITKNEGLRFIAKICLNNLWGHFGMKEIFTQSVYISTTEEQIDIVFNEKYQDVSQIILNEDFKLMEYKTKK